MKRFVFIIFKNSAVELFYAVTLDINIKMLHMLKAENEICIFKVLVYYKHEGFLLR